MTSAQASGTEGYAKEALSLFDRYERRSAEDVHAAILKYIPTAPANIVDIGAGTGRDAAWFAAQGHDVVAVEPTTEFREPAKKLHPSPRINWLDDSLPELSALRDLSVGFDLVMMTAVWMHLDEDQRQSAISNISAVMRTGAKLFMSLRHGPVPKGRRMFDVSADETIALAASQKLIPLYNINSGSMQPENQATGVTWTKLVFELRR